MSKIVLFSDPHLGLKLPHAVVSPDQTTSDRLEDVCSIFEQVGAIARECGAERVMILGDLFDKAHPSAPVLVRAARELIKLTAPDAKGKPRRYVDLLPGNHDAHDKSGNVYSLDAYRELDVPGLNVMHYGDTIRVGGRAGVVFWPVPWSPTTTFRERVEGYVRRLDADDYNVLLFHQTVKGARDGAFLAKKGIEHELFDPFDRAISGHIHEPQEFVSGFYLGSPLHLRFTDANSRRGCWVFDTDARTFAFVPLRYPEFLTWHFAADDELDTVEFFEDVIPDLEAEVREILTDERDIYLDVKIEGEREEVAEVAERVRGWLNAIKSAFTARIRQARIVEAPFETVAPSERMKVVKREAPKGKLAAPNDLLRAYVRVQETTLPGEFDVGELRSVGENLLSEVGTAKGRAGGAVKYLSLALREFGVFGGKVSVDLDNAGQVIVLGNNRDTDAANSNGSGKTTIFKGLQWVLFGRTIDGLTTNVIHRAGKKAVAELTFETGGSVYRVSRTRTAKTGSLELWRVHVTGGDERLSLGNARDTQAAIEELIGMDFDAFRCTTLFGQGDHARFAAPGLTDAARKGVLSTILRLDAYERAKDKASELRKAWAGKGDAARRRQREIERDIGDAEVRREKFVGRRDVLAETRDAGREKVSRFESRLVEQAKRIGELETELSDANGVVDEATADLAELETFVERAQGVKVKAESVASAADEKAAALATSGPCPSCGRERDYDGDAHEAAAEDAETARNKAREAREVWQGFRAEKEEVRRELDDARRERDRVARALERARSELEGTEKERDSLVAELRTVKGQIEECDAEIESCDAELSKLRESLRAEVSAASECDRQAEYAKWWVAGFGAKGVPAYAVEQALPVLNRYANAHLAALTDGDISVTWSATATGSTGTEKEQLSMQVMIEGVDDVPPSGGQQKKIELATEVALGDLMRDREGATSNLMVFDEVFDGLDHEGTRRVLEWLATLPQENQFVVSHRGDVADDFETVLLVVKDGQTSTIEVYE